MAIHKLNKSVPYLAIAGLFISIFPAHAQNFSNPTSSATFAQTTHAMGVIEDYEFGTGYGRAICSIQQLGMEFNPYGIAGTTVINQEWQIFRPFNVQNFVFTENSLDITATIPKKGGLFPGGIDSGQIWSKKLFKPGLNGYTVYAFEVRMRMPTGPGMWSGAWFYTPQPGQDDHSEIDNPEFFVMKWQNEFDWTSTEHGPGVGKDIYSIKTNQWAWHPGLNFSADYHNYQTVWTPDSVYKYVDGTLVHAQYFKWTAPGPPSIGVTLSVGSSLPDLIGLQPNSLNEFPANVSVDHIKIWAK